MTEEETAADRARKDAEEKENSEAEDRARRDAEAGAKLDKVLEGLGSISNRMDTFEKRMDAFEAGVRGGDNDRLPGEPAGVIADSQIEPAWKRNEREAKERLEMIDAQARADSLLRIHGSSAPEHMAGETPFAYRRRLARHLQRHSKEFGKLDLSKLNAGEAFDAIENRIYADAQAAAMNPEIVPGAPLRSMVKVDPFTGARITTFHGDHTFIRDMKPPARRGRLNMKPH
jgi:hypothetical protein